MNGPVAGSPDRAWTLFFLGCLGAILVLRVAALGLNATDLFFDEAQYWAWSREPSFGYYSKPPLIAWLIRASTDVCGLDEFCIRLPSPLLHALTAAVVFALGSRMYDARVGALAGLAYATMPGVSLSSGIISTDVPLLLAWSVALLAVWWLATSRSWWPALVLGVAFGAGLNAKYAMAYVVLCLAVVWVLVPERRALLTDRRLYAGLALGAALIAPNIYWNATHDFATFSHTADNAKWDGPQINPLKALEFIGAQFGVFGPVLFAGLLAIVWRARRERLPETDRMLLAFSLPVLGIIVVQAGLSRAHANWAAVSYVAAVVLVTAHLVRAVSPGWWRTSMVVNVGLAVAIAAGTALAGRVALPGGADPLARTMGWEAMADATRRQIQSARDHNRPFAAIITDQRAVAAELLYYLRDETTPVLAWREAGPPRDHFELTRPYTARAGEPVLLVSVKQADDVTGKFTNVETIAVETVPTGPASGRAVTFFRLSGMKAP